MILSRIIPYIPGIIRNKSRNIMKSIHQQHSVVLKLLSKVAKVKKNHCIKRIYKIYQRQRFFPTKTKIRFKQIHRIQKNSQTVNNFLLCSKRFPNNTTLQATESTERYFSFGAIEVNFLCLHILCIYVLTYCTIRSRLIHTCIQLKVLKKHSM